MFKARLDNKGVMLLNKKMIALKKLSKQDFSNEIAAMGFDIARIAKKRVVVDTGNLRGSIVAEKIGQKMSISAKAPYAPYIEFGTGKVTLTDMKELGIPDSYAEQFKGKKAGNMKAQPFFFISAREGFRAGINRMETRIKKLTR